MTIQLKHLWAIVAVAVTGCGDNSTECGPGTDSVDGVCTPSTSCGPGTKADDTGVCVPDPADCQDGTVLINNVCVDPTSGLTIDLEEGMEPNGLGVVFGVENSANPAGVIMLKPVGETTVVHGHITPFQDANGDGQRDPDFDTYLLAVDVPTLLDVSVDGVGGIDGAFYVIGGADGLSAWERYGVNASGDTSSRRLFLPEPGVYAIVVADTRSMSIGNNPPASVGGGGAAGGPNAEYYMSLTVVPTPTPKALTIDSRGKVFVIATVTNEDVKFFSAPMGLGFNEVSVTFAQAQANPSIILYNNDLFRREATQVPSTATAAAIAFGGIDTGDNTVIVVDQSFNTGVEPIDFDLEIATVDAKPLSRIGAGVDEIEISNGPQSSVEFNIYFIDVAAAGELDGLALSWNHAVDGAIADQDVAIVANFTFDPKAGFFVGSTFTDYHGAVRFPAPGRYYFFAYDPAGTAGTDTLTATSTITALPQVAVAESTPLVGQTVNTFNLLPFRYDPAADPWQQFDVTSTTGNVTGTRTVDFLDPATAFGSLSSFDAIIVDPKTHASTPGEVLPDPVPIFAGTFTDTSTAIGHIVGEDPITSYLVTVQTATATGAVTLAFDKRTGSDFHDFGTVPAGTTVTDISSLTAAAPRHLYLVEAEPGSIITVTLPATATEDLRFAFLHADETDITATRVDSGGLGATETLQFSQGASGFTALSVSTKVTPIAGTLGFALSIKVDPGFYTAHDSATAFDDACNGGNQLALHPTTVLSAQDEGLTAVFVTPAGFTFYGVAAPQLVVSSNGFISFDTALDAALSDPSPLPDHFGNANVDALWEDLDDVVVCSKSTGTKLIIQWTGVEFASTTTVRAQAILDGADSSIELVYGAGTTTGTKAVAGVQNPTGTAATETSDHKPITPNTSKKLTHP